MTSDSLALGGSRHRHTPSLLLAAVLLCLRQPAPAQTTPSTGTVRLPGHVSPLVARSRRIGTLAPPRPCAWHWHFPPRDPQGLDDLLRRLYDPQDPLYGHYLTPAEFTARFGPTPGGVSGRRVLRADPWADGRGNAREPPAP